MNRLASLAASVIDRPTLEEVDAMLTELQQMPRNQSVTDLIDNLLDYRAMLPSSSRPAA